MTQICWSLFFGFSPTWRGFMRSWTRPYQAADAEVGAFLTFMEMHLSRRWGMLFSSCLQWTRRSIVVHAPFHCVVSNQILFKRFPESGLNRSLQNRPPSTTTTPLTVLESCCQTVRSRSKVSNCFPWTKVNLREQLEPKSKPELCAKNPTLKLLSNPAQNFSVSDVCSVIEIVWFYIWSRLPVVSEKSSFWVKLMRVCDCSSSLLVLPGLGC